MSARRPSGQLLEDRRWFRSLFAIAELLMAGGFLWALVDGWNAMPSIVTGVFLAACCVGVACAASLLWERRSERSATQAPPASRLAQKWRK